MENTFLNVDIPISDRCKELLQSIPVNDIVSWAHLELWCITRSIEIDKELTWFLTVGAAYFDNLFDIILDAIKTTDFMSKYVNSKDYVELVYKVFQPSNNNDFTYSAKKAWMHLYYKLNDNLYYSPRYSANDDNHVKFYKLMAALDCRFPLIIIQFYDTYKRNLHVFDLSFVEWIMKRSKIKAENSELFKLIYAAMEKEYKKQQRIASFLM